MNRDSQPSGDESSSAHRRRGRLKIFFGMSPGVGKTYAMLQAAHAKLKEGVDVVAGVVETHGRAETEALLAELEAIPLKRFTYRGTGFREFNLDAALERQAQIVLVDELAHTNVPGSRHPKRYQDVEELLSNGVHVYTTVNVQHLESRADQVEALSGVVVRERVPDTVLEWADEIEIVDLSPEGLRRRLEEGKVYLGDKAATAAEAFFSARNLSALREMALRSTAERVNRDLVKVLKQERDARPLPTGERIMVAVGPSPFSERLIRWTKRYADSLNAGWVAAHVEQAEPLDPKAQKRLEANLELARQLGAEIAAGAGEDIAASLLRTARRELVTQIVVGRSPRSWLRRLFSGGSLTERLVTNSQGVAVHVVPGERQRARVGWARITKLERFQVQPYLWAAARVLGLGLAVYPFRAELGYWTIALLFLSLTIVGGFIFSRGSVLLLALLSALGWNFFYVPPQFTFRIHSGQDILLFLILLLVAVTMGQLTARLRALRLAEQRRETRTFALFRFLDCLNLQVGPEQTIEGALAHASEVSGHSVHLITPRPESPAEVAVFPSGTELSSKEKGVVEWVFQNGTMAGAHTGNLPEVASLFVPVPIGERSVGVLRVQLGGESISLAARDLLLQMSHLLGRFLERENLRARVARAEIAEASQRLQKTLLDTVSHELKTPLTIILSALEQVSLKLERTGGGEHDLIADAECSARRLLRNVNMLLDMTRFEGGVVRPKNEFVDLYDLCQRLREDLVHEFGERARSIDFRVAAESIRSDEALLYQLFNQLLANALGHTPAGTNIHCEMRDTAPGLEFVVSDDGPGLPENVETLFEPFSHGSEPRVKGLGLGLSIARRISQILGGSLHAASNLEGGARFTAILPGSERRETP